ncbi:sensor histidine kinase [Castellaniella sp. MT123]|uniref:sensor histidine kinase n=1 Tax=Castellaniella sp. MT123 TaxID=3140381 RepID=UPI0031F3ED56
MILVLNSLYARLVTRVGVVLVVSAAVLLFAVWWTTNFAARQAYDRILTSNALQIAENTWFQNGAVTVDVPITARTLLAPEDKTYYAVVDPNGRTIAGDIHFKPSIPWDALRDGPVLSDGVYDGHPIRIAIVGRRMPVEGPHSWAVIMVAQTTIARSSFARSLTADAFLVILVMGVLTLIAAMFTLHQALAPLKQIEEAIRKRDPLELSPLSLDVPVEIRTLVDTVNGFMRRLATHQAVTRRVIGDAAHQLRTPVTALLSRIELLSIQTDEAQKQAHLARLRVLTRELGQLVNQLINHAMVQQRAETTPFTTIDLAELVRTELAEALSNEPDRDLDVAVNAPDAACLVRGDPTTLREAVKNIIHNALRYGAPSLLQVDIVRKQRNWEVRFLDDGPGIPPADWDRVRRPFSSRSGGRSGASLGLAIVQEVMRTHRGKLRFALESDGRFMVVLIFRASA